VEQLLRSLIFHWTFSQRQWRGKQFASGGGHAGRKFFDVPLTFLLCPPHEGAQRLFVTD